MPSLAAALLHSTVVPQNPVNGADRRLRRAPAHKSGSAPNQCDSGSSPREECGFAQQYCDRRQSYRLGFPGGGGPRETDQRCGRAGGNTAGGQLTIGGFYCFVCGGSSRELSKRFFHSSHIFDMISNATSVVVGRCSANSSFRLSRVISTCSGVSLPIFFLGCLPSSAAIAEVSPFADLGRIDALRTQIRSALTWGGRYIVSRQVDKFLRRRDQTPARRTTRSWRFGNAVVYRTTVAHDGHRWAGYGESVPSSRPAARRTRYEQLASPDSHTQGVRSPFIQLAVPKLKMTPMLLGKTRYPPGRIVPGSCALPAEEGRFCRFCGNSWHVPLRSDPTGNQLVGG